MATPNPAAKCSTAAVATPRAGRYLVQLCKHFQHRLPVMLLERSGRISFQSGDCLLRADEEKLAISLEAADDRHLHELQDVVERHLLRFGFREDLIVSWQSA